MFHLRVLAAALLATNVLGLSPVGHTPTGQPIFRGPPGSTVVQSGRDMKVFTPNGTVIHVFEDVVRSQSKQTPRWIPRQELSTTEAFVTLTTSDALAFQTFNVSFVVPPEPATFESQIIYFSTGLQLLDDTGEPQQSLVVALQYGASVIDGGPFWTAVVLLQFLPSGGFFESFDPNANPAVNAGDRLSITIRNYPNGPQFPDSPETYYFIAALNNRPDILSFGVGWEMLPQKVALGVSEEGAFQPSDYPRGSLVFEDVSVNFTTGFPAVTWNIEQNSGTDVSMKIDKDGSRNAQVSIVFPDDL
ncbi:hypothetical protein MIND_01202400 [Mycena indigotica]|uniref:Uncharacterized protein n=1 Tax=Mycena indigotica TaxID=2126181 RepID=A0A8H6S4K1_9AGAR|nr:uncharacterized protein MIND_01202400 [Mycena indigotica]KAF7293030.1 hypothetical protein MIND_01202400 [Mycena indigotica]